MTRLGPAAPSPSPQVRRGTGRRPQGRASFGAAEGLGWFSVALGVTELVAPGGLARLIGVPTDRRTRRVIRLLGLRELVAGVGLLSARRRAKAPWLWSRVAGDVMDLALLGRSLATKPAARTLLRPLGRRVTARLDSTGDRSRATWALAAVAGVTALDVLTTQRTIVRAKVQGSHLPAEPDSVVMRAYITIDRSPEHLYVFWRTLENLPRFMPRLQSVQVDDEVRSRWRATGPVGTKAEWSAAITEDQPNELIAWKALDGDLTHAGEVRFRHAPGGRGAEVSLEMRVEPPLGKLGRALARPFRQIPEQMLANDLRRFKQLMELGEIVRSDASVHDRPHPARPEQQNIEEG